MQPHADLAREGQRVLTVCNACRYCEAYCPVFHAMEDRRTFELRDLTYLANLCHDCGECLYACQYAPPHEFAIHVPRTMASLRTESYRAYAWPARFAAALGSGSIVAAAGLAATSVVVVFSLVAAFGGARAWDGRAPGDFYEVLPHHVMAGAFGAAGLFALIALAVSLSRFWRDICAVSPPRTTPAVLGAALRDVLTLRHLHGNGEDCPDIEESRMPWRRYFHHCTLYGFFLCFASTTVAAIYHSLFGWRAPYAYHSAPVVLGLVGGLGLLIGPTGLLARRRWRDPALADTERQGFDVAFTLLLLLTSGSGLLLLHFRDSAAMGPLLVAHLGIVLALFLTMPYGKFVHGFFRAAALLRYAQEQRRRI